MFTWVCKIIHSGILITCPITHPINSIPWLLIPRPNNSELRRTWPNCRRSANQATWEPVIGGNFRVGGVYRHAWFGVVAMDYAVHTTFNVFWLGISQKWVWLQVDKWDLCHALCTSLQTNDKSQWVGLQVHIWNMLICLSFIFNGSYIFIATNTVF